MLSECPPEAVLGQLLTADPPPDDEDALEWHIRQCVLCQGVLDRLTQAPLPIFPSRPQGGSDSQLSAAFRQRLEDSLSDLFRDDVPDSEERPPVLAGYELFEVIGRGGSSIVYRGRDLQLQRPVAVKVLRERAGRAGRERFSREAKALAALNHPHITRVIEVGEADGRTYLVLEYVAGESLGRFINGEPQPPRAAAHLVRQLAEAMHTAHLAGLVHRDLKPGNILLDPRPGASDEKSLDRYNPRVSDFGIVKNLHDETSFTQTRECLGTPSYMAPEQVQGATAPVDGRTDVYALGAILYELLTGRPPFRAGTPLDTMLLVKQDDPVAPSRLQPKVPRDLETICLKCLEKSPSRRYATAQLLADDLTRYLDGRAVLARPIPWYNRCWRWARRHPGWAAAIAFSTSILLAAAIGGPLLAQREFILREEAQAHERLAKAERGRAREHLDLASEALERTLEQALRSARLLDSALDEVRANLIRGALPYLQQFVEMESADRPLRLRQCRAFLQLADVHLKEKHKDKALAAYQRALAGLELLQSESPFTARSELSTLALAHLEVGRFHHVHDQNLRQAEHHYRQALALNARLLDLHPRDTVLRDQSAILNSLIGSLLMSQEARVSEARSYYATAVQVRVELVAELPQRQDLRHYAAMTHMNLGMMHRKLNESEQELEQLRLAWEMEKPLQQADAVWLEAPYYLATLQGEYGIALFRSGRRAEGVPHMAEALRVAEALCVAYPAVARYEKLRQHWRECFDYAVK